MAVDLSAIAKWPNVPACYDWLSLDRRGQWRLQGERVNHAGLLALLNAQYGVDETGCWFVQNGPQRVFVSLACTPWVFRREANALISHTGQPVGEIKAVFLDEEGNILFDTALGIGLLDDRELAGFLAECQTANGQLADESAFLDLMAGLNVSITWQNRSLQRIAAVDLPKRFKFQPHPKPQP